MTTALTQELKDQEKKRGMWYFISQLTKYSSYYDFYIVKQLNFICFWKFFAFFFLFIHSCFISFFIPVFKKQIHISKVVDYLDECVWSIEEYSKYLHHADDFTWLMQLAWLIQHSTSPSILQLATHCSYYVYNSTANLFCSLFSVNVEQLHFIMLLSLSCCSSSWKRFLYVASILVSPVSGSCACTYRVRRKSCTCKIILCYNIFIFVTFL